VQEERKTSDGAGRYQLFEHGSVSWRAGSEPRATTYQPWAVVLCRFKGSPPDPTLEQPIETFYRDAFSPGGASLVDYWREVSLGAVDITGSRVLGWLEVALPRSQAGGAPDSSPPGPGRSGLINAAVDAVRRQVGNNALDGLAGPIAVYTQNWSKNGAPAGATWQTPGWYPFWIDGSADGMGRVALTPPHNGNITAHEMGHVLGMGHDVGPDLMTSSDYSDPCCIMSQNGSFSHPRWNVGFGPAVCLPHLVQRQWINPSRVLRDDGGWLSQPQGVVLPLAPVTHPEARANLGVRLAYSGPAGNWDYYLEYVIPTDWNRGVAGAPYVFVRRTVTIGDEERPAYLGFMTVPPAAGTVHDFVEPSGNVRFTVELTDLPGPIVRVGATKL
jgi:M6 family metalloprotease-like protein